jgi:hypothetical protein
VKETGVSQQFGSAAKETSPNSTEAITDGTVSSDVEEIGVSDGYETLSAVVVGGSPTVVTGTGVS